jgi:hypothetical protein
MSPRRTLLLAALLLLCAWALRLYRLEAQSLWWDEGISLHLATSSFAEIVRDRLDNIHPPLYFFILKGWLALVGASPFTGRYLSALASLVQVALIFSAARYWSRKESGGALTPWLATALILISPLSVIYGQEIRVYAFLPLVYLAMLLSTERILASDGRKIAPLLVLGASEWLGLHLHYIALFGVAYVGLWGSVAFLRRGDRMALRRWLFVQVAVIVACLPWFLAVARNLTAIGVEANAGTFTAEAVPLSFLFAQVWAFHLTGLAGSLASDFVQVGAIIAAAMVIILLALKLTVDRRSQSIADPRPLAFRLAAHWLLPLISALVVWNVRSFSHPRYIVMFAALFIPLAAALLYPARRWLHRLAALFLAAAIVSLSIWGLRHYFFDSGAAKPDMRGVARYLESKAGPDDLIIVPDTDWSLPFEYEGAAAVIMPRLDESPHDGQAALIQALDCTGEGSCARSGRVFVVGYPAGTRDWQARLPFELERRGHWLSETRFDDLAVREYKLTGRTGPLPDCGAPELAHPAARFGPLRLEAAWIEQGTAADTAVAVALCWRLEESASEEFVASLILSDPVTGERVAQSDNILINPAGAPTTQWSPGATVVTYHLLPLSAGTPPIDHVLAAGVYPQADAIDLVEAVDVQGHVAGRILPVGTVSLSSPVGGVTPNNVESPPLWEQPVEATDGLELIGARFSPGPYRPGQTIRVGLAWRATADDLPDLRPALALEQGESVLAENAAAPVNGRYPTNHWRSDQVVFEYRDVRVPADAEGTAMLVIQSDTSIPLGEVTIEAGDSLFTEPPVSTPVNAVFGEHIALIGFDPPSVIITPSQGVPLTLYWHLPTGEIGNRYTVFVHLLAEDGRVIAQHDSPPANGQRPTDEWLPGEYIIDPHELVWRESDYTGPARIAVGLYDPVTGERLLTGDGADYFLLPIEIAVE